MGGKIRNSRLGKCDRQRTCKSIIIHGKLPNNAYEVLQSNDASVFRGLRLSWLELNNLKTFSKVVREIKRELCTAKQLSSGTHALTHIARTGFWNLAGSRKPSIVHDYRDSVSRLMSLHFGHLLFNIIFNNTFHLRIPVKSHSNS